MAKAEFKVIGSSPARMGGVERVIGKGIYGIDLMLKDQLHGAILRSQYAHAKIVSIDTSEAQALPGVHAVVTSADAPNVRYGRSYIDRYILARGKVRFMGDPVAAVAADSLAIAKQALKKIKVVYEALPVVIDPEEATKADAPVLHDDMPLPKTIPADGKMKNICGHMVVHVGDPERAMAEADVVVDEVYETKMIHPQYLEPRIAAAQMEPNGRLTVWANAQAPFPVRQETAKMLGLPLNNVRVIATGLGGGFGGKGSGITSGAAIEPICALLAMKAKRPVMIVLDKAEETISTTIRSGARMYIKTGVKKDGTIVARTGKVFYDAGGYSGFGVQAGGRCTNMLGGWYLMPNCHIDGYTVYTNKQVCGPVRGPGGPQAAFAVESHMDSIAAKLGMDPTGIQTEKYAEGRRQDRRRAQAARCIARRNYQGCQGENRLGHSQSWRRTRASASRPAHGSKAPVPAAAAIVKVNEDGSVTVHIGKIDMGTIPGFGIPMIVAEELGIPVSDVTVVNVDTDASPWDAGTVGSRGILVSGTASRLAAIDARNQIFKMAATQTRSEPRRFGDRRQADPRQRHAGEERTARDRRYQCPQRHRRSHRPRLLRQLGADGRRKSPRQLAAVYRPRLHRRSESRYREREDSQIRRRARHRSADSQGRRRRPDRRRDSDEHRPGALRASRLRQRRPHHEPGFRRLSDADHQHDAAHRNDSGVRLPRRRPLRLQRRRRNRLRPADGSHRQRDLQRHRRADHESCR